MTRAVATALVVVAAAVTAGCSDHAEGTDDGADLAYWVNPDGQAARQAAVYREQGADEAARLVDRIARQPVAEWLGVEDPRGQAEGFTHAATAAGRAALLVLYNIPHRDCGQYSRGGAADGDTYRAWLDAVADGIADRAATVILEPDALPHVVDGCTPVALHEERYDLLRGAIERLTALPRTRVYLDAGNPHWIKDPGDLAAPLRRAGIERADGFALNTSNYQTTAVNIDYGRRLSAMAGGKPFVIDTSRNGNGPAPGREDPEAWCNPAGRALGETPTRHTGKKLVDAYLWIKRPGESDGTCKGGPPAGEWWPRYALDLVRNTMARDAAAGGAATGAAVTGGAADPPAAGRPVSPAPAVPPA